MRSRRTSFEAHAVFPPLEVGCPFLRTHAHSAVLCGSYAFIENGWGAAAMAQAAWDGDRAHAAAVGLEPLFAQCNAAFHLFLHFTRRGMHEAWTLRHTLLQGFFLR